MSERICAACGNPATGFASVWTPTEGERWYCHGDDDDEPTCYEAPSGVASELRWVDLFGIAPDFTGGVPVDEWLDEQRGDA